jgi:hypothetical protein
MLDRELERLLRLAHFSVERARVFGLTADIAAAVDAQKNVVAHPAFSSLPADARHQLLCAAGTALAAYGERTKDASLMEEALSFLERASSLGIQSQVTRDQQTIARVLNDLHEMTDDLNWLRRIVEVLALGEDSDAVEEAQALERLRTRLSVLEQIWTLTQDETDAVFAIEAACDLLRRAPGHKATRQYAVKSLVFLQVDRLDAERHQRLLRTIVETLSVAVHQEPPGEFAGGIAAVLTVIAVTLTARFEDEDSLGVALIASDAALCYPQSPLVIYAAATARTLSYQLNAKREDLDRAIELYQQTDERLTYEGLTNKDVDSIRADLLFTLLLRAVRTSLLSDWAEIDAYIGRWSRDRDPKPPLVGAIAHVHLRRYEKGDGVEQLEQARHALTNMVAETSEPGIAAAALNSLVTVHEYLYEETGELGHWEEARSVAEQALAIPKLPPRIRAEILSNLGARSLRDYELTKNVQFVDKAIEFHREAADTYSQQGRVGLWQMNLGNALVRAYEVRKRDADLEEALNAYRAAADAPSSSDHELGDKVASLGFGLTVRFFASRSEQDRSAAVAAITRALSLQNPESIRAAISHMNLAQCLALGGDDEQRTAGIEFERACTLARSRDPSVGVLAGEAWAEWAERRQSWEEAARGYGQALEALYELYDRQLIRAHQEFRLGQFRDLARRAAIACVHAHDLQGAALAIEHGRALWLADTLGRKDLEQAHLERDGRAQVDRLRQALRKRDALRSSAATGEVDLESLRLAVREVKDATEGMRRWPGYQDVLTHADWDDVLAAAEHNPLVYLVPGHIDGIALIVNPKEEDPIRPVTLPGLSLSTLFARLELYFRFIESANDEESLAPTLGDAWPEVLDDACAWAWDHIIEPVLAAAGRVSQLTLVPVDALSLLPLHASWTPDPTRPSGRRYACDEMIISYAPSAVAQRHALAGVGDLSTATAIVVVVPDEEGPEPLHYAAKEPAAVAALATPQELVSPCAKIDRVISEIGRYDVVHFACHATARIGDPLTSSLVLDDGELRLETILGLDEIRARLVVLSACETALPGTLIDEGLALSAGFLKAGANAVISSLWKVWDDSTLALMIGLYRALRSGLEPAAALTDAQRFVRELDVSEWLTLTTDILGYPLDVEPGISELFASPDNWAAFTIVGA